MDIIGAQKNYQKEILQRTLVAQILVAGSQSSIVVMDLSHSLTDDTILDCWLSCLPHSAVISSMIAIAPRTPRTIVEWRLDAICLITYHASLTFSFSVPNSIYFPIDL